MAQVPHFALRKSLNGRQAWAIGAQPDLVWQANSATELLQNHVTVSLDELSRCPEGIVVGLLPYPDKPSPGDCKATLLLFRSYAMSSRLPEAAAPEFRMRGSFQPDTSEAQYVGAAQRVKDYLSAGDAYQVNLAQRFSGRYEGHPWQAFTRLAHRFDPPQAAWIQVGDLHVLSMSPELFLSGNGSHIETHPIKGTRPRHANPEADRLLAQDLAKHPKDQAENLMIVDLLRNDLNKVCEAGSVRVPDLFRIETQPNVHHLVSTVTGRLRSGSPLKEVLLACFPGGSITGAPKRRAMEIISELEPHPRRVYCGTIFWATPDGAFGSSILIRTFLASNGEIHGWAGAGIVSDSNPDAEYQECLDKLRPLMDVLTRNV